MISELLGSLPELLEMVRATKMLDRAQTELKLAKALCMMDYMRQEKDLDDAITGMLAASPYETLTRQNIMARARAIVAAKNPCDIDHDRRAVRVVSFGTDSGVIEVMSDTVNPAARDAFFTQAAKMNMDSEAKMDARFERLSKSKAFKAGMPVDFLLRKDMEYEQAGHPLCPNCKIHHPPHDSEAVQDEGQDCERTLH